MEPPWIATSAPSFAMDVEGTDVKEQVLTDSVLDGNGEAVKQVDGGGASVLVGLTEITQQLSIQLHDLKERLLQGSG